MSHALFPYVFDKIKILEKDYLSHYEISRQQIILFWEIMIDE